MSAEGWYIDGTPLEEFGRVIENRDGWDDTPPLRGENVVLLGRHGESPRRMKYGPGRKTLAVAVHGVNEDWTAPSEPGPQRALYEKNLDGLLRLIRPRPGMIPVLRVYADGSRRTALCQVINALTPSTNPHEYTYGQVSFELNVPGSFWLDEDARTYRLPYDVAGPDVQTVEAYSLAGGTAPCSDAVVTITGPCDSISVRDAENGSGFSYGPLDGSDTLVVDAGAFSAVRNATPVLTDLTIYDELLELSAAPTENRGPAVTISAPGKGPAFRVVIEARRAWLR